MQFAIYVYTGFYANPQSLMLANIMATVKCKNLDVYIKLCYEPLFTYIPYSYWESFAEKVSQITCFDMCS